MSRNIRQMEADRLKLVKELEDGQSEMANGPITQARGEELESKAQELEVLQGHIDQYNRIAGITKRGREVINPVLPGEGKAAPKRITTTPGHLFVASEAFRAYRGTGKQGWSAKVGVKNLQGRHAELVGEEAEKFETKAYDPATLSDLGTDAIIERQRDREIVRYEEPEILTIRDVLATAPVSSDSIQFVRHVETERAASAVGRGGLKPYLRVEIEPATATVQTIAVLSKVTEQDIDDAPRLIEFINGEMRLDVKVEEERQLLWSTGSGNEIDGLFNQGVEEMEFDRSSGGDTVIDTIRRMRTDLRKRRVIPSAVMIDPIDWENVELEKGSDLRYVWGLVSTLQGPRIWSLRVVESDAMTHPDTGARRILMGDWVRGATLYDRHDVRMAVGFVDDDFARNLRTLRAEERLALAVKRAHAFSWTETYAGDSSS